MFRGREQSRPELGFRLLQRLASDVEELGFRLLQKLADDVTELGFVESQPKQDGRNMIMVIGPHRRPPERKAEAKPAPAPAPQRPVPSPRSEAPAQVDAAETTVEPSVETPAPAR